MDSKSLMIGDWIGAVTKDGNTHIGYVDSIGKLRDCGLETTIVRVLLKDKKIYVDCIIGSIHPIPLTAEILEKNGFVTNTYQAYIDGIFLDFGLDGNAFWWQFGHCPICPINYVHELQHALRLCGLNELAENFKVE